MNILASNGQPGQIVKQGDKVFYWVYWDGAAPTALAQGQAVQFVPYKYATGKIGYKLQTVAAQAAITPFQGVACDGLSAAGHIWVQVEGTCELAEVSKSDSLDAGGESLELIANGTTLIYDADTLSAKTVAIILETNTGTSGSATKTVYLLGRGIVSAT